MGWRDFRDAARDAVDIARRARGLREVAEAIVPGMAEVEVLNEGAAPGMDAAALIRALRGARNSLKGQIDGRVDYRALRQSEAFDELVALTPALRHVKPSDLPTDAERIAFFINLYNVLAIHGVLALGIERSVMEIPAFFSKVAYRVGDVVLTLDQMENGVLRRNAGHPATKRPTLPADSLAHAFAPSRVDPRIHAALVCASTSCPPVGFYDPEHLDAQLRIATANWVNADVRAGEAIELPIMFRYYAEDWGGRAAIEAFLLEHADEPLASTLRQAFEKQRPFEFSRYDWSLNVV